MFPFRAPEYLKHHPIKLTLLYKRFSIPGCDKLVSIDETVEKETISLFVAYKREIYAFIYCQADSGKMEDQPRLGSFLKVLEDEEGQEMLDLNAYLFRLTRNHALGWLERTSAGNTAPLSLTMESAVDVDYLKIWRLGGLGYAKNNSLRRHSGNNRQTTIFDAGSVRRIVRLSITLNNIFDRPYRISIVRMYFSNDGIIWSIRDLYSSNELNKEDPQLFHFNTVVNARYFKFEIDSGKPPT